MTIAVFTPTIRPGIDVSVESIRRQTVRPDVWIVSDHLKAERAETWRFVRGQLEAEGIETMVFNARELTERPYTIQAAYNQVLRHIRSFPWSWDLLVTMEDYVALPADAIERFERMARLRPDHLLGGIVNGSADPGADQVVDPDALYSIFDQPYTEIPSVMAWEDCRLDRGRAGYLLVESQRWEPPLAALPKALLDDDRLTFNEEYDQGMTHGNQWFSALAQSLGHPTVLDLENQAWALPHHLYWPEERAAHLADGNNHAFHEQQKVVHGWA